ncbi:MAG: hypothetical protein ACO1QB_10605 [Verrucomicrobiales bacterium]
MSTQPKILFCNCTYAQVVPVETKKSVLQKLCQSDVAFDAVADLCEMAARRDPRLLQLAEGGNLKIAACYPRAVKWLFASANAPLALDGTEALNMRVATPEEVIERLFSPDVIANLPTGKETPEPAAAMEVSIASGTPAQNAA